MLRRGPVGPQNGETETATQEFGPDEETVADAAVAETAEPVTVEAATPDRTPAAILGEPLPMPAAHVPTEAHRPVADAAPEPDAVPPVADTLPLAEAAPVPPRVSLGLSVLTLGGLLALWRDGRQARRTPRRPV